MSAGSSKIHPVRRLSCVWKRYDMTLWRCASHARFQQWIFVASHVVARNTSGRASLEIHMSFIKMELAEDANWPSASSCSSNLSAIFSKEWCVSLLESSRLSQGGIFLSNVLGIGPHVKGEAFLILMSNGGVMSSQKTTQIPNVIDQNSLP